MIPTNPVEQYIEDRKEEEKDQPQKLYSYEGMTPPKVKDLISFKQWVERGTWASVVSSNVDALQYSSEWEVLSVRFIDGSVYKYRPVPLQIARELFESNSIGKFLHKRIKKQYATTKVR